MRSCRMVLGSVALLTVALGLAISGSAPTAPAAASFIRVEWTWSGADQSDSWRPDCNWHPLPTCQDAKNFPDDTGDNATILPDIDNPAAGWSIDLTSATIGDLRIEENVDFGVVSGAPTLDVQQLVIVGDPDSDTIITIAGGAKITITNP